MTSVQYLALQGATQNIMRMWCSLNWLRGHMPKPSYEEKLAEAAFFLDLFDALQLRDDSISHGRTQETEAAYLFSAILGAFYAALDQWNHQVGDNRAYQAFKKQHPEVHGSTEQGGWRNTTVHLKHVPISETQQVPTSSVDAYKKIQKSKLVEHDSAWWENSQVHLPEYRVDYRGRSLPVLDFCHNHLQSLREQLSAARPLKEQT